MTFCGMPWLAPDVPFVVRVTHNLKLLDIKVRREPTMHESRIALEPAPLAFQQMLGKRDCPLRPLGLVDFMEGTHRIGLEAWRGHAVSLPLHCRLLRLIRQILQATLFPVFYLPTWNATSG